MGLVNCRPAPMAIIRMDPPYLFGVINGSAARKMLNGMRCLPFARLRPAHR
jgi:hypothetical protein